MMTTSLFVLSKTTLTRSSFLTFDFSSFFLFRLTKCVFFSFVGSCAVQLRAKKAAEFDELPPNAFYDVRLFVFRIRSFLFIHRCLLLTFLPLCCRLSSRSVSVLVKKLSYSKRFSLGPKRNANETNKKTHRKTFPRSGSVFFVFLRFHCSTQFFSGFFRSFCRFTLVVGQSSCCLHPVPSHDDDRCRNLRTHALALF
jgi:hypothetical protein